MKSSGVISKNQEKSRDLLEQVQLTNRVKFFSPVIGIETRDFIYRSYGTFFVWELMLVLQICCP